MLNRLKAICAFLKLPTGDTGTAYLIARGRLATAFHVVKSLQEGGECEVLLGTDETARHARLLRVDEAADAAILALDGEFDVDPLPIADNYQHGTQWDAFGYPALANRRVTPTGVPLSGTVIDRQAQTDAGQPALLLFSQAITAGNPLHGFSGSPVVVDGALVGHLTKILGDPEDRERPAYGYVYACPNEKAHALLDVKPVFAPRPAIVARPDNSTASQAPLYYLDRPEMDGPLPLVVDSQLYARRRAALGRQPAWRLLKAGLYQPQERRVTKAYTACEAWFANCSFDETRLPIFWITGRSGDGKSVLLLQIASRMLAAHPDVKMARLDSPERLNQALET